MTLSRNVRTNVLMVKFVAFEIMTFGLREETGEGGGVPLIF